VAEILITCPDCGSEFELSGVLESEIREQLQEEFGEDVAKREEALAEQKKAITAEKKVLETLKESVDDEVEKQLKHRMKEVEEKVQKRLSSDHQDEMDDLNKTLSEQKESITEFRKNELELRRKQQELEEAKENAELENARKLDEERAVIKADALKKAEEEHRLKDLEKDKQMQGLKTALADAQRKAEQGSMETQGEVLEQDFEAHLKTIFVHDKIEPVPKGIAGADIIQTVRSPLGNESGILLWEMKNTKTFSNQWIPKLKQDMIQTRAAIAILVTVSLPEGIERFGPVDGVWVSDPLSAIPLAMALREQLVALENTRKASEGKNEKMEFLYQYLAGTEFSQKIMGIVNAFQEMHTQLQKERGSMQRSWSKREKQLELIIKNTSGLYGDMQGIIGGTLQTIPELELDDGELEALPEVIHE
jgi:hypothetical protein